MRLSSSRRALGPPCAAAAASAAALVKLPESLRFFSDEQGVRGHDELRPPPPPPLPPPTPAALAPALWLPR